LPYCLSRGRRQATSSTFINSLYPGDITTEIDSRSRGILLAVGHTARQYNPTVRRVVGEELRANMPRWDPTSGEPFIRFTLPSLELRRLLAEVRERNESFSLEYTRLRGRSGDEAWRTSSPGTRVWLEEDSHGGRTCLTGAEEMTGTDGRHDWVPCDAGEVAMMAPPSAWERRVMLFFPLAIEPGAAELPCVD